MPQEPRDGSIVIGGHPWMARMIDKARLDAAGEIDQLDLEYPCPMDQRLLRELGVDGETFQRIAVSAKTDDEIVQELKQIGARV
jgi:hypothetical protein